MAFMMDKFKGKYRLQTEVDQITNDFPRDLNGTYSDHDIYIDCLSGTRIFYYGKGYLDAYIPSLGRGRNIIKAIYSDFIKPIEYSGYLTIIEREKDGETIQTNVIDYDSFYQDAELNKIINVIIENDEEVTFRFKWDLMEQFEKYFKPKTSATSRSPFSSKNLPKCEYEIPEEDLKRYKEIVSKVSKEHMLQLGRMTNEFITGMTNKRRKLENIKADMKQKCLKSKEYIHAIGRWDEYLKFMEKKIRELQ